MKKFSRYLRSANFHMAEFQEQPNRPCEGIYCINSMRNITNEYSEIKGTCQSPQNQQTLVVKMSTMYRKDDNVNMDA